MLKDFENWLLNNNYRPTTAFDYQGRIEKIKEPNFSAEILEVYIEYLNLNLYTTLISFTA